ncbi:uncharacterized protein STEHIDRAFT_64714 [Stereum hirsutum FP-91666 SS1]|uniref:uncharacterized protein n=1 Tax=Stereum hirsutum (strain FP-91666) TaxID=721885 RepID=UPI000444A045|nr:uncharacterized protein STEHIDRAFT_64714 [Stereum hirsutum FP-91666 SS1]EIM82597.1 hypothetical protein STEHIDRAFT_64714 [Stereum hirsutum FP-91666 SS1]
MSFISLFVLTLLLIPNTTHSSKAPVVRGARACTVCRAAKMKCVGAEDGTQPCQRCKRSNSECIFEKHRRGRKPGSKLSEASKMLRRLEKGLSSAKSKAQALESSSTAHQSTEPQAGSSSQPPLRHSTSDYELPPLNIPPDYQGGYSDARRSSHDMDPDQDEDDADRPEENIYPARLIRKENQRQPFLKTILNPQHEAPLTSLNSDRGSSTASSSYASATPVSGGLNDPVAAGIIEESNAKVIFDLVFLRLNPFINLFDAILHTPEYVRKRSPFLFTVLIMAGCKFFKPECYKDCQKLAYEFAVRAFAEGWKSVEVVQAFACLTYWKEPDDTRTWTYIGYACRMAVELGLNRWVATPARNETELVFRERRNRERTYLVLFVHDRSLSMQTGRQWMLPECNLVRNSANWHEEGGPHIRPEDVILAAFVQLRRIAAETTDILFINKGNPNIRHADFDGDVLLRTCNSKLTQWAATWEAEMRRAPDAEKFHYAFLDFFRLYVRLFLNSAGIQASLSPQCRATPSLQALSACYSSAMDHLKIVTREFASMSMLRYGQDTVTVMTAYAAVFLLKVRLMSFRP